LIFITLKHSSDKIKSSNKTPFISWYISRKPSPPRRKSSSPHAAYVF